MPDLSIKIGGRSYTVSCQDGEERFLETAAKMLDDETRALGTDPRQLPEARVLLMAGLLVADRVAGYDDARKRAESDLADAKLQLQKLQAELAGARDHRPATISATIPADLIENLAEMSTRAESLADRLDDMV